MKRNLHRCIYTSSYDRGLEHILKMWPDIRKEVPDAELHVFYGWQLFVKFYANNPSSMGWKAKMDELMTQEGITDHGRVPQHELIPEMEKSGLWVYPTHFGEINCISALKAQAYGCEPVVVNYAALETSVQFGRKIDGDIYDQETKDEFKKQVIDALKNPISEDKRKEMVQSIREQYSWDKIAADWDKEFNGN